MDKGLGLRVYDTGFSDYGLGSRVQYTGFRFMVQGPDSGIGV